MTSGVTRALSVTTCRQRLLHVLSFVDEEAPVVPEAIPQIVAESSCRMNHELHYASLETFLRRDHAGLLRLNSDGATWLLEYGRPPSRWGEGGTGENPPLRPWQAAALDEWAAHGRHGVVEAVTGTGKSRVGVEAALEALADDFSVLVIVPSIDLAYQWLKAMRKSGIKSVGMRGDGADASFRSHAVVIGTVQSLYENPPTRPDGGVLVIADECHRYGSGQWRRALHPSYRRRLGLTATFERSDDDGIDFLISYFGGPTVYSLGFAEAIRDGIVAHYDVKRVAVDLTSSERSAYDQADEVVRDCRLQLLAAGFEADQFGVFLKQVQEAAEGDEDPTIEDLARRYLKAFSSRIDVLAGAKAKLSAAEQLAPLIRKSRGALVFTSRVDSAEHLAERLRRQGVRAQPVHGELSRTDRQVRLDWLRIGRLHALVAPNVLDEGIDVPEVDLGVVLGGSRSRRQMIQRMGRVLRLKKDGRRATFVVVYARNTIEDVTQHAGDEGCLDLIIETADSVEDLDLTDLQAAARRPAVVTARIAETDPVNEAGTGVTEPAVDQSVALSIAPAAGSPADLVDHLERLAHLYAVGALTVDEFSTAKARLLGLQATDSP